MANFKKRFGSLLGGNIAVNLNADGQQGTANATSVEVTNTTTTGIVDIQVRWIDGTFTPPDGPLILGPGESGLLDVTGHKANEIDGIIIGWRATLRVAG